MDVSEHFSDTAQEKSEANHVQITASQEKKKKKRRCYVSFSSKSSSTDMDSEPVNKHTDNIEHLQSFKNLGALCALKFIPIPWFAYGNISDWVTPGVINPHQLSPCLTGT